MYIFAHFTSSTLFIHLPTQVSFILSLLDLQNNVINNIFVSSCISMHMLSTREVCRARKRLGNSSLLSAIQTSQVLNILTYTLLKHELIIVL